MMRQTAVDMENSENLIKINDGYSEVYFTKTRKCKCPFFILIISHLLLYGFGFYSGYLYSENSLDGSI